jgi:predicted ABC-type ATPase
MQTTINPPILLHMLGIPGAGKTTFLNMLLDAWQGHPRPILLGFDQVMQSMPDYATYADKETAFAALELPARALGYKMLNDLIAQEQSILFDNGGSAASHPDLLRSAQNKGYTIVLVAIRTPVDVAAARVS